MTGSFRDDRPIFQQIREIIEDQILNDQLPEGEQAPSTNQLVNFYKVNHLTVSKGINQLVEEGILYKKRGVGMFVAEGAKAKLIEQRKASFVERYVRDLLAEAEKLNMSEEELTQIIQDTKRRGQ
ncbi:MULTISPECIES: GntR family transcriptional regulator [Alkalibacillus]|uniref:DNA-binding transcriptional regulator YhcF (GntR family) n=1 Tax=Alkalibacillus salilacus TaxID=284582 RepID=A0ABT9VHR7_9BACI|nr:MULTISPECIES: GntR family transcriptional regulator [Alkalibacillus]MDQ0160474.1 DNA-binding transcriptional regulator YhcF (GntR family) [Alkalibacillus salilacus]NIK13289.1 DNA-binding transcriptional regulator YhcF (GntR family) [Alkalibacillus almallahensis]